LVGFETTIGDAVSITCASLARPILHAVVSLSVCSATIVVTRSGAWVALEGINTETIVTADGVDGGRRLSRRTVVVGAIKGRSTGLATTILHAVRSRSGAV